MSVKTVRPIPDETASAGNAIFKKGAFYQNVGDQLGELCKDHEQNSGHISSEPHVTIPLLFLVTVFQYLESMSDSQATFAVLNRVDWKYALHLPLISLGFDQNELEEYHKKMLADPTVLQHLNVLLERVQNLYDAAPRDPKKMNTTSMMDAVQTLNRLSQMVRAMRLALDELAIYHPQWLKKTVLPHWFDRYARSGEDPKVPETQKRRETLAMAVGEDGFFLLDALRSEDAPTEVFDLPEVEYFNHVWNRQFKRVAGKVKWRTLPKPSKDKGMDHVGARKEVSHARASPTSRRPGEN